MKRFFSALVGLAILSFLLPRFLPNELVELGQYFDRYLYFYRGSLILSSVPCALQGEQLMISSWGGYSYVYVSLVWVVGALGGIVALIRFIARKIKGGE